MRAAYYSVNGPAEKVLQVGDIDTPAPGPGEVRVALATSGINPSDTKAREGTNRKIAFPIVVPHSDGAGEIDVVGSGVDRARIGTRVWLWDSQWQRPHGTAAQYTVVKADRAVELPNSVGFEVGACLGSPARTASNAVVLADLGPDATVLVSGGAGGVGHYAIQFAKARGATVITTVSNDQKAELAREAGADHIINYRTESTGSHIRAIRPDGVDAVIELDLAANAGLISEVLRPHGSIIVYGTSKPVSEIPSFEFLKNAITLRFMYLYKLSDAERRAAEADITAMVKRDQLRHNVGAIYDLNDIVAAHEAVEQGSFAGNIVLSV